jgi:hypothetical protein
MLCSLSDGSLDSRSKIEDVMTVWYLQSMNAHDTHRGPLRRGRVLAVCGVEFSPLPTWRKGGAAVRVEPTESEQMCPECSRTSLPGEPSLVFQAQASRVDGPESRD